jgi:hypothetical protein
MDSWKRPARRYSSASWANAMDPGSFWMRFFSASMRESSDTRTSYSDVPHRVTSISFDTEALDPASK